MLPKAQNIQIENLTWNCRHNQSQNTAQITSGGGGGGTSNIDDIIYVDVCTTVNILLDGTVTTLDGITITAGQLILVQKQDDPLENGIYTYNSSGLTRYKFNPGQIVVVNDGTIYINTLWQNTNTSIVIGTTEIYFKMVNIPAIVDGNDYTTIYPQLFLDNNLSFRNQSIAGGNSLEVQTVSNGRTSSKYLLANKLLEVEDGDPRMEHSGNSRAKLIYHSSNGSYLQAGQGLYYGCSTTVYTYSGTDYCIEKKLLVYRGRLITAPEAPVEGDFYIDIVTNYVKMYDGTNWIILNPTSPKTNWFETYNFGADTQNGTPLHNQIIPASGNLPYNGFYEIDFYSKVLESIDIGGTVVNMANSQTVVAKGYGNTYLINCSSANATAGSTYTNNGYTFTVLGSISSGITLLVYGTGNPSSGGTLTKASGTGDTTITFSAYTLQAAVEGFRSDTNNPNVTYPNILIGNSVRWHGILYTNTSTDALRVLTFGINLPNGNYKQLQGGYCHCRFIGETKL